MICKIKWQCNLICICCRECKNIQMLPLIIHMNHALALKSICPFSYPFIGDPFTSNEDWTTTVKNVHIRSTTSFNIMPKHGRASSRSHCYSQPREGSVSSFRYLQMLLIRQSYSSLQNSRSNTNTLTFKMQLLLISSFSYLR